METVIKVENISKAYHLGEITTGTLAADLQRWYARRRGKEDPFLKVGETNDRTTKGNSDIVWSVKDVSFEVQQGDAVGIIGRNGAGKSTLLKILSKVTSPTSGHISGVGRIASLLEVGTGFHPELTGRENIYLNGAILGMKKKEIKKKFDEIVDFSGVERYVDTPVKRYSSGMYVRLAFAVAAHLESEILIIDEVLAVGDAEFQKKCLGKMSAVTKGEGRTVLFVSHNMAAVKQLCNKGIVLRNGVSVFNGTQTEAVNYYQSTHDTESFFEHAGDMNDAPGNENIRILKFAVKPMTGEVLSISSGVEFELQFYNNRPGINLDTTFELRTIDEVAVFHYGTLIGTQDDTQKGVYTVKGQLQPNLLNAGIYRFKIIFGMNQRHALFIAEDFIQFEVLNEAIGSNAHVLPGVIRPKIPFTVAYEPNLNASPIYTL